MAEVVLDHVLDQAGLLGQVAVSSSGVSAEEHGNPIDRRARQALIARGYQVPAHRAHRITDHEVANTDLILAMTYSHYNALLRRGVEAGRLRMLRLFDPAVHALVPSADLDIDDPWYGGPADFEAALDQIEAAMPGLLRRIRRMLARQAQGLEPSDSADGWQYCTRCRTHHWGVYGAAGLLVHHQGEVLMQLRSARSHHGKTWGLPGGGRQKGEAPKLAALREASEETGLDPSLVEPEWWGIDDHQSWSYTTVVARATDRFTPTKGNWETAKMSWVPIDQVAQLDLHPGLAHSWPMIEPLIGAQAKLIVDGANLVGSRPDGWWKDRAGAAERLRDQLAHLADKGVAQATIAQGDETDSFEAGWWADIELVVEGQAKGVAAVPGVAVVAAPAEGDNQILEQVALALEASRPVPGPVVVATADKALAGQVRALGAGVVPPGRLLRALRHGGEPSLKETSPPVA